MRHKVFMFTFNVLNSRPRPVISIVFLFVMCYLTRLLGYLIGFICDILWRDVKRNICDVGHSGVQWLFPNLVCNLPGQPF